jgi:chromosomal replication initiation ATPase DnaA
MKRDRHLLGVPLASMRFRPEPPALEDLLLEICCANEVTVADVRGRRHHRAFVRVRRQFARAARAAGFTYPAIGAVLGRHHTSVMNLLGKV